MDQECSYTYTPTYLDMTPVELSGATYCGTPDNSGYCNVTDTPANVVNVEDVLANLNTDSQHIMVDGILNPQMSPFSSEQLQQLLILYRGFPLTNFIGLLKRAYAECEIKMDSVRTELFRLVKQKDNFPFGGHDLKKTR